MLQLSAAQLKEQIANGVTPPKPIWIDLGGGTGKKKNDISFRCLCVQPWNKECVCDMLHA